MLQPLPILGSYCYCALDGLSIHVQRHLLSPVLLLLDIDHGPLIPIFEYNVDIDWCGEEVRHGVRANFLIEQDQGRDNNVRELSLAGSLLELEEAMIEAKTCVCAVCLLSTP